MGNLKTSTKTNHLNSDVQEVTSYTYDAVGNRKSMTVGNNVTSYEYNGLNQLTSMSKGNEDVSYTYDARGNQVLEEKAEDGTVKETVATEYAATGEMTKLTKTAAGQTALTQENKYNQEGQRISKSEAGKTRNYYYENGAVCCTRDGKDISTANILSADRAVVGSYRGDVYSTYLKDVQGSTSSIVKEDGSLNAAYKYTDFGETEEITGNNFDNEICYTGAIYDEATGLYYMNARYYNPANGRFISQDSYRGEMNDPEQWHLYAYCANNPINYVDINGHSRWKSSSKTIKYYSPVVDAGHQVWRVKANISVEYKLTKTKKKQIRTMCFWATGDKHSNCGNGSCPFVNVKIYKNTSLWKKINGYSSVVEPGDGLIVKPSTCVYTDKKITKNYTVWKNKVKISAYYYFSPPKDAVLTYGKGVTVSVSF